MLQEFIDWIVGLIEDDPIPYEIEYLIFCLDKSNDFEHIMFAGNEKLEKCFLNFEYFPLEAQFFNVYKFKKNFSLFDLRKLIENALHFKNFKKIVENKKIIYGIYGENVIYSVENT